MGQLEYVATTCSQTAGKYARASNNWCWFCFSLVKRVTRVFPTNHSKVKRNRQGNCDLLSTAQAITLYKNKPRVPSLYYYQEQATFTLDFSIFLFNKSVSLPARRIPGTLSAFDIWVEQVARALSKRIKA